MTDKNKLKFRLDWQNIDDVTYSFKELTDLPIIDAHVHAFPDRMYMAVKRWFELYAWPFEPEGQVMEMMSDLYNRGVEATVLMNYAHQPGLADFLNSSLAEIVGQLPRAAGLGAVHPDDDNPGSIVHKAIDEYGLHGIKIHTHVIGVAPDDPRMFPIYEAVLENDGIMNIHAGREPASKAYGLEVHSVSGVERTEQVLKRYPELKLIIPHLGFDEERKFYRLLDKYPNLYLDTAMVIVDFFPVEIDLRPLADYADRILFGTDYPHIPYPVDTELRMFLDLELGDEANRKILHENARKLFGFKPDDVG